LCEVLLPVDPILGAAGKVALGPALRAAWRKFRQQIDRRGDVEIGVLRGALSGSHYDEAIEVLLAESVLESPSESLKAFLSDRPPLFDEEESRDWLRTEEARSLVKLAVEALIDDRDIDEHIEAAAALYERLNGDAGWRGGDLLVLAAGFVAKSVIPRLSLDTLVILDAQQRGFARVESKLASTDENVSAGIQKVIDRLDAANLGNAAAAQIKASPDAAELFLRTELRRQRRRLALDHHLGATPAAELAARAWDGDLMEATAQTRCIACRWASASFSRHDDPDSAQAWLDRAATFGGADLRPEEARIMMARGDPTDALRLLDGLTDSESVAVSLNSMNNRDGPAAAFDFFRATYLRMHLSGHSLAQVSLWLTEAGRLPEAEELLTSATEQQIEDNPVLLLTRARLRLALCSGPGRAAEIAKQLTILPPPSTLRDDSTAKALIAGARADVQELRRMAKDFAEGDFLELLQEMEVYFDALMRRWAGENQTRLSELVSAPDTIVRYAPMATMFDVDYDRSVLEGRLAHARRIGGLDPLHLRAAFDELISKADFAGLAQFITENREALRDLIPDNQLIGLEVESLARSGHVMEAKALLEQSEARLQSEDHRRIADIITEEEGADALSVRRSRFLSTDDDHDLELLVRAAVEKNDAQALADYAPELWRRRKRLADARLATDQLLRAGREDDLRAFIAELDSAIDEDDHLRLHAAWSAFGSGDVERAQDLLGKLLQKESPNDNVRNLNLQLHVATGDWEGLGGILHQDLEQAESRSATQLLQSAGIAAAIRHPDAFDLATAAAAKGEDDPRILMNAYLIALQLGREGSESGEWFQKALKLNGEDGPLKSMPSADLPVIVAQGRERSTTISAMLMRGELPISLAVRPLNMTVSGLIAENLTSNENEPDARKRVALPLFAGNRLEWDVSQFRHAVFDHTTVLLLHFLGVLDQAIDAFEKVIIPAGLMATLLNDLGKARSGQTSRAVRASSLRALVEKKRLKVVPVDGEGADHGAFDAELNRLAAEAERLNGTIVHTYPIYEPGSFMDRISDPTPILDRLASPRGLVTALAKAGAINPIEEERALSFPGFADTWPAEANIDLSRPILLDGLAVTYLSDAEILEPLARSGADVHISDSILEIGAEEMEQLERAELLARTIDDVRRALASALSSGRAVHGATRRTDDEDNDAADALPLMNALADVGDADLVVCDDRMINRHGQFIDRKGAQIPTATTIDLINMLAAKGLIDDQRRRALRERLRRSGATLVPVTADEIVSASLRSDWSFGAPREVAAIKDSIHLVLLRDMLLVPEEIHWLATAIMEISRSIRRVWVEAEIDVAEQAATYLYRCIPHEAASLLPGVAQAWSGHPAAGRLPVAGILAGSFDVPEERREAYEAWLNEVVLDELEAVDPLLLKSVADSVKSVLLELAIDLPGEFESAPTEEDSDDSRG
jgi:hypothetical protein